jgi:hypothetical protein
VDDRSTTGEAVLDHGAEFAEWAAALGGDGAGIPFLRYLPERLGPLGERVG